jgi:hypothetical protein
MIRYYKEDHSKQGEVLIPKSKSPEIVDRKTPYIKQAASKAIMRSSNEDFDQMPSKSGALLASHGCFFSTERITDS